MKNLNEQDIDALSEIGNVGIGNATTSLSKVIDKRIDINIPETRFVPIESFADELGGAEKIVNGLYLDFSGDVSGQCVFAFSEESALKLSDLLLGNPPGTTKKMGGDAESAFKEMSNIFVGSYLSALANMFSMSIFPSTPNIACDMVQAVIDVLLISASKTADNMLTVKAKITMDDFDVDGSFLLIFDEESLKKIISILVEKFGLEA